MHGWMCGGHALNCLPIIIALLTSALLTSQLAAATSGAAHQAANPIALPACPLPLHSSKRTVELPAEAADGSKPYYASTGIEKAVALARYTDLMHTWLLDQWKLAEPRQDPIVIPADYCAWFPQWYCPVPVDTWGLRSVDKGCVLDSWLVPAGCVLPPPPPVWPPLLGRWERQSQPLAVNKNARQAISDFLPYFEKAMDAVNDPDMQQEVDLMNKLVATKG
jgi:Ca-activated chloride channel family protein